LIAIHHHRSLPPVNPHNDKIQKNFSKKCDEHLLDFLPSLLDFHTHQSSTLHFDDLLEITEAIGSYSYPLAFIFDLLLANQYQ